MMTYKVYGRNEIKPQSDGLFSLYWRYKKELWGMTGSKGFSRKSVYGWYKDILSYDLFLANVFVGGNQAGFVFIACGDNCPMPFDYYVMDCYILPEHRHHGIMYSVLTDFVGSHPGGYCLFIIDSNAPAKRFWEKVFGRFFYKEQELVNLLSEIKRMEDANTHFHAWR